MLYRMMNDARARVVAKDLQQIARELGMDMSLTGSQALVSQMMGYRDWKHLQSELGVDGITGPEDGDLMPTENQERMLLQTQTLIQAGFQPSNVPEILSRLRPTGRSATSSARNIVAYPHNERYHPNRLASIWFRLSEHCDVNDREFEETYEEALYIWREWAGGRRLSKLDAETVGEAANPLGDVVTALEIMMGDAFERGWLIDASQSKNLSTGRIDEATLTSFPKDWEREAVYVHLGKNAFPSPYADVGVEGVYLEVDLDETLESEREFHISATVVCGEPNYTASSSDPGTCRNVGIRLRDNLRFGTTMFYAEGDEDLHAQIVARKSRASDLGESAWTDYLSAPINAAMNALGVYLRKEVPIFDAVPFISDDIRKKVERAATDNQLYAAIEKAESDDLFVRSLARAPITGVENHELRGDPVGIIALDAYSVDVLIDDSFDMQPDDAVRFMRVVHDLAYGRRNDGLEDNRVWVRSLAALLQAELHNEEYASARRTARDLENSRSPAARTYLPLAWLTHRLVGFADAAKRLEQALGGIKFKPLVEDALNRLGDVNAVGNFMENGAHRPFMVQMLEAQPEKRKAVLKYTETWHYGHDDSDDIQVIREAYLSGPNSK